MQPHRRGDEAESKASCSVDKGPGKGAGGEQCKIEGLKLAHGIPQLRPPRLARREMGQRLACYSSGVVAWTCLYLWIRGQRISTGIGRNLHRLASAGERAFPRVFGHRDTAILWALV